MLLLLLTAATLAVVIFLVVRASRRSAPVAAPPPPPAVHLDSDGDYETDVVGEARFQEALAAICGGRTEAGHEFACVATLKPEPENPYDGNAIAVWIQGRQVGYLARPLAAAFTLSTQRNGVSEVTCDAVIVGGWDRGDGGTGHFGVRLDLFEGEDDGL